MHNGITVISSASLDCFENMGPNTEGSDLLGLFGVVTVKECRDLCLHLIASDANCHGFTVRDNMGIKECIPSIFSNVEVYSFTSTSVFYKKIC